MNVKPAASSLAIASSRLIGGLAAVLGSSALGVFAPPGPSAPKSNTAARTKITLAVARINSHPTAMRQISPVFCERFFLGRWVT